jgi:hypothetical protein
LFFVGLEVGIGIRDVRGFGVDNAQLTFRCKQGHADGVGYRTSDASLDVSDGSHAT